MSTFTLPWTIHFFTQTSLKHLDPSVSFNHFFLDRKIAEVMNQKKKNTDLKFNNRDLFKIKKSYPFITINLTLLCQYELEFQTLWSMKHKIDCQKYCLKYESTEEK